MRAYVVLLRGINVGGRHSLPMATLVSLLEDLGCSNVSTYIQSGNVVLRCPPETASALASKLGSTINEHQGFEPRILILEKQEFLDALSANPFTEVGPDSRALHLGFLDEKPPNPDLEKLGSLKADTEQFRLIGRVFYLYAPDGIARSRLAARSEKLLGAPMTDRNWRTVRRIGQMLEDLEAQ